MTGIMIGFTRARHRLGTVYGNYSLTAADTGINAAGPSGGGSGDSTINLPASPYTNQTITINNIGTGTVTVSGNGNNIGGSATTTIASGTSKWFAWGGYTWGFVFGGSCETVTLPATKDFGTTTQGPAETPYTVPDNTITYSNIGYTPCGGLLRKIITSTYAQRGPTPAEGGGGYEYYDIYAVRQIAASAAACFQGWYSGFPNLPNIAYWNACPVTGSGFHYYYYGEPTYSAPAPVTGVISIYDNRMTNTYSGGELSCDSIGLRGDVEYAIGTYTANADAVGAAPINAYYLDTHIVWTYEII